MDRYLFQYCQKIVVLSKDKKKVLLCKRKAEADYDGAFSFIGGKMETSDSDLLAGLKREKNEEVGEGFKIKIYLGFSSNLFFRKKDGNSMILPHYLAIYESGEINLNEEYSEYKWVSLDKLKFFEPKIPSIPQTMEEIIKLESIAKPEDFILI